MILSTCNRVEILVIGQRGSDLAGKVVDLWCGLRGQSCEILSPHLYVRSGLDAIEHIFTVASGLDSMVLGEPQILGQIKDAYRTSVDKGSAKVILNRLLHKTFSVAKRVRTETSISASAVSVSYAAVELAKHIFGELTEQRVMLVGAGEMAELAARHLQSAGVREIMVANRTLKRGEELAARFSGRAIPFAELLDRLHEADIVITSTGSPETVIRAREMKPVLKRRKNRPMFFIDIAVPRDVDPDVNNLDNIYLYDIDDLKDVVEENLAQRKGEAVKAGGIVREEVVKFEQWLDSLELNPTIKDLYAKADAIAQRELRKSFKSLGGHDTPEVREIMETLANSLTRKLYHEPVDFLKRRSREEGSSRQFIHLVRRFFNLDEENVPEDAHKERRRKD
jgi:glutamyl-tRNA reductase